MDVLWDPPIVSLYGGKVLSEMKWSRQRNRRLPGFSARPGVRPALYNVTLLNITVVYRFFS